MDKKIELNPTIVVVKDIMDYVNSVLLLYTELYNSIDNEMNALKNNIDGFIYEK